MRAAVLGGTVSGVVLSRRLVESGHRVDLFRNLFDPTRSIHSPHPFCEYQASTCVIWPSSAPAFVEEVNSWTQQNLTEVVPGLTVGRVDGQGCYFPFRDSARRLRLKGGYFGTLAHLMEQLPSSVTLRPDQLVRMERAANGEWWLWDLRGRSHGPYDVVLGAYDMMPRAARKTSFKQLFESALPLTSRIIASAAYAVSISCISVLLHWDSPPEIGFDSLVVEGVPELRMIVRNHQCDQTFRGLHERHDTWTLVATPEWSVAQRPDPRRGWDKEGVSRAMVLAMGRILRFDVSRCRMVIPTFLWQGCSSATQVVQGAACAFDPDSAIGWCGDIFGGLGPEGAVVSANDMVRLASAFARGRPSASLPGPEEWGPRIRREGEDDIACIHGPCTGRRELDHTWDTAVHLACGRQVDGADSLRTYRQRGVQDFDLKKIMAKEPRKPRPGTVGGGFQLRCQGVHPEGLMRLSGIPEALQEQLLISAFPTCAEGTCGGNFNEHEQEFEGPNQQEFPIEGKHQVSWHGMGYRGGHTVSWGEAEGNAPADIVDAARAACSQVGSFNPDTIRVSFARLPAHRPAGQRWEVRPGTAFRGWSQDEDFVDESDRSPKLMVLLGHCTVTWSFKCAKADKRTLDVELRPGDILILSGRARSWWSAITAVEPSPQAGGSAAFDFTHVSFVDQRRLQKARPAEFNRMREPGIPKEGDPCWKWVQVAYKVLAVKGEDGIRKILITGRPPSKTQVEMGELPAVLPLRSARRHWSDAKIKFETRRHSLKGEVSTKLARLAKAHQAS